jgi:hypothetical protein
VTEDPLSNSAAAKNRLNQRQAIKIDENDDTLHNAREFKDFTGILSRGAALKARMTDALEPDEAWNQLHGENEVAPKQYVAPFL